MATDKNYPIDLPILVIEAQIFVAVNKFQFLPNKLIPIHNQESIKDTMQNACSNMVNMSESSLTRLSNMSTLELLRWNAMTSP